MKTRLQHMSPKELKHFNLAWHSTQYQKLKRIDRRHFLGKRSVVILKIIYFLSKWFLEFTGLASTFTKKQSHHRGFRSNFCVSHFPFRLKDCLCFQVMQSRIQNHFKHISNIGWSFWENSNWLFWQKSPS